MKVYIGERSYDMANLERAHLSDLIALKRETGLGVVAIQQGLSTIETDNLDDDGLIALGCLVWLTRRRAGEVLTLEQACDFPLESLRFETDPGDEVAEEPDPTQRPTPDGDPVAAADGVAVPI